MPPLAASSKICSIAHNNNGKFICFLLDNKQDLPTPHVYDLRETCPGLDRYWHHDFSAQAHRKLKDASASEIILDLGRHHGGPLNETFDRILDNPEAYCKDPDPLLLTRPDSGAAAPLRPKLFSLPGSKKQEMQVYELKVLKEFEAKTGFEELLPKRHFMEDNFEDDVLGLDSLRLDEGFS